MKVSIGYGSGTLDIEVDDNSTVIRPVVHQISASVEQLIADALDAPVLSTPLEERAAGRSVLVIVSDESRNEPRKEMLAALHARLAGAKHVRVAVANGTHVPRELTPLALPFWAQPAINHDSRDPSNIVEIGTTSRGTPLRLNRTVLDADLIIAAGAIRPHYFAGFGGGVKAIFPGLGENSAIRVNHQLKALPAAVAGNLDENPCRDDLEEVLGCLGAETFLLNVVEDPFGSVHAAVAGDIIEAHRVGATLCGQLHRVSAPRSRQLVVADRGPVSRSLYQTCKLLAAVAPLALPGALIVVAAECAEGLGGDYEVIEEAIFELGIRPRLPTQHELVIVSPTLADCSGLRFCRAVRSFDDVAFDGPALVIAEGGASLLFHVDDASQH